MNIYDLFKHKTKTKFNLITFFPDGSEKSIQTIITVDATLELEQSQEMSVTDQPVEKGKTGFINDHLQLQPLHLSIRGKIDNEPLDIQGAMIGSFTGAVGTVSSKFATPFVGQIIQTKLGEVLSGKIYGKRAKQMLETLMSLQINKVVFQVVSKLRIYNNMVLGGLTIPATQGDDIEFSGSLREIAVVETSYATIEQNIKKDVRKSTTKKKSLGSKSVTPLADEAKTKAASKILVDSIKEGLGL